MTKNLKALATLALTMTVAVGYAQTTAGSPGTSKKVVHHRKPVEKGPSVQSQIEELRQQEQMDRGQIDTLKQQLSDRDAQLQQAQQAAQQAQQAAQAAQQAAESQQQTLSANSEAVSSLKSSVDDLKANSTSIVSTIQQQQTEVKKALENNDGVRYHGITISPHGSFVAAETVWRQGATGGGLNTPFTGVPLNNSPAGNISEFYGSGRQSRIAIKASGKDGDLRMTGYYEMDWLSSGTTSNNNQSNSYTMRQRQIWGQAALDSGWKFTGGQMWSLTTETSHLLDNGTEILPSSIDPQYMAGFVWNRQYGFRASKDFGTKFAIGASAENDQMLVGGSSLPTNELIGSNGTGGGLYDNQSTYSFNLAPEMVAKMAFEPGWGHWELFGVGRFFHDRVYPTGGTPYNDSTVGGGIGAGFRAPLGTKNLTIGLKGLYGDGTGRMGSSTIEDATLQPDGQLALLHTLSSIGTVEANVSKRLMIYLNYGGDYVSRDYFGTKGEGYGSPYVTMTGCNTESVPSGPNASSAPTAPANCSGNTKDVQEFSAGDWYNFYNGPKGRLRFGLQYARFERDLWSGVGGTTNPGGGAKGVDNMFWTSFRYYVP
ncbi:MAG TPA: hypothetical protein VHZ09_08715 [Acidobacteriaceae bacterium]|jgi:hypothetical protein|nr:hypothetical protein [Acidobacteriaceae bacterium]